MVNETLSIQEIQAVSTGVPRNIYRRKTVNKAFSTDSYKVGDGIAVVQAVELPVYVDFRSGDREAHYVIRGGKIVSAKKKEE